MLAKLDLSNNEIESIPDEIGTQEVSNDFSLPHFKQMAHTCTSLRA